MYYFSTFKEMTGKAKKDIPDASVETANENVISHQVYK